MQHRVDTQDIGPDGIDLSGPNGTTGFVLIDHTGATTMLHDPATDSLTNVIANTALALDIRQQPQATITPNDLGYVQDNVRLERLRMALGRP